jgi:pyruvate, water dikinase
MIELVPLTDAHERERYGGKAVGLARLCAANLPVPAGYALAPDQLRALASAPKHTWRRAHELGPRLALRSSAIDEDSKAASFAGQHESVLGIASAHELAAAAERVIASGEASRPYREARGLGGDSVVAAVLQRLIEPVASGVLFTRDPITGAEHAVIEAAWGLGEAVVQGLVDPDRFVIDREGVVTDAQIGHKDVRIGPGGEEEVPAHQREISCMPTSVLSTLLAQVRTCEAIAGGPADVEWAWDGRELWFLQCRAITTL